MSKHEKTLKEEKANTAAVFDVDGTLIAGNCTELFIQHVFDAGILRLERASGFYSTYKSYFAGETDYPHVIREAMQLFSGLREENIKREANSCFNNAVRRLLVPDIVGLLRSHKEKKRPVVLATASLGYIADELGRFLEAECVIANRLSAENGVVKPDVEEPLSWGEGKAARIMEYAANNDIYLEDSYFYTNGLSDLPSLELFGHQVLVDPGPEERRAAEDRGWDWLPR